ncbi:hypothetical protein [Microbacterium sp. KRD172]|uniref:hypothetical protein n=1 Tax=Microbacterium sp. KRD172 TaxID=2729727 RepID=UPI0019D26C03|nr:hypothetical protein [Microbacterium sp. KRD172]
MAEDDTQQNPFTRPGFIVGAVVVAALIVTAIVLTVLNLNRGNEAGPPAPDPSSSATTSAAPTPEPSGVAGGASVCGLGGEKLSGTVTTAPAAEWKFQDVYAYPTSTTFGPGKTATEGYPYCFQHSPEGALFAAANVTIIGFGPADQRQAFLEYALTDGPYRDTLLSADGAAAPSDVRASIAGFRVLAYDGDSARVDIAFRGSSNGQSVTGSAVYELVWADGDWKLDATKSEPARVAQLPDLSGYVSWTEE